MLIKTEISQRLRGDIIKLLYYKKGLSLTELSKLTKRSVPLVTSVINSLKNEGYVIEKGVAPSTGGRRPAIFLINPAKQKYIVAVAMDQLITSLVIYNLAHDIVLPLQLLELDINLDKHAVDKLISFINNCIDISGLNRAFLLGIGLGMPGFVNAEKGVNDTYLPTPDGSNLRDYLKKQLALPVLIDNDSTLIALAELHFGKAAGLKDVLVVNIGWGTGLGMIMNGSLYRGSSGYAGEFSHIPLSNSDALCSCGKRGCLEVETSLLVIVRKAEKAVNDGEPTIMAELFKDKSKHHADHFLDAVIKQDSVAISILFDAAFLIGKGVATLIHIMNPERIVLSGRGAKAGKMLLPPIQQAINKFCIPRVANQTNIVLSNLAEQAELLAAASLLVEHSKFD